MKPIFKYMGGKQNLIKKYSDVDFFLEESKFERFVDLFCGGCAVSIAVAEIYPDKRFLLNDKNRELIQLYRHIQSNLSEFFREYESICVTALQICPADRKSFYLDLREQYADSSNEWNTVKESAALLFMLRNNFNGLWRCSKRRNNRYFTAPGKLLTQLAAPSFADILGFHEFLQRCELSCGSYDEISIEPFDWVYADPPYRGSRDGGTYGVDFADYESSRLCGVLKKLQIPTALSNLDLGDGFWQQELPSFGMSTFPTTHRCGIRGEGPEVSEALIKNY